MPSQTTRKKGGGIVFCLTCKKQELDVIGTEKSAKSKLKCLSKAFCVRRQFAVWRQDEGGLGGGSLPGRRHGRAQRFSSDQQNRQRAQLQQTLRKREGAWVLPSSQGHRTGASGLEVSGAGEICGVSAKVCASHRIGQF